VRGATTQRVLCVLLPLALAEADLRRQIMARDNGQATPPPIINHAASD
jgi:hypothetical protein